MTFRQLLLFLMLCSTAKAFKILVLFPTPSYSHQRPIMALTEGLVRRGHELFVVSPNSVPELAGHKNYTFVDVSFSYKTLVDIFKGSGLSSKINRVPKSEIAFEIWKGLATTAEDQFSSEAFFQFQQRVKSTNLVFDAVIVESLVIPYTCAMAGKLTGMVPIVSLSSIPPDPLPEGFIGNIVHLSFVPFYYGSYTQKMTLWQKMNNWFSEKYMNFYKYHVFVGNSRRYFTKTYGFGSDRLVDDCYANISIALLASNSLDSYPRLLSPNVIETGPLHLKTPERLPENLQVWLDEAEKGVIYFSLGSNLRSELLPATVLNNFFKVFTELSSHYRVLWKAKFDVGTYDIPQNVLTQSWMPQHSILAHQKVKLFITQGGFQSLQEAIHFGVPTVGIPQFADQDLHVSKMVDAGIGVRLQPTDLHSSEKIRIAIESVLHGESYSENIKKMSAISRDFSSVALEKAAFWVEHVAKHGGAAHLRPMTADTTLFEFFCMDIITKILSLSSFSMIVFYVSCKFALRALFRRSNIKIKRS